MCPVSGVSTRWMRASVAISVPSSYFLLGAFCVWHDFGWVATVVVGVTHLLIFAAAQPLTHASCKPIVLFMYFVVLGILIFVTVWIVWRPAIYVAFPLALVGSVAWSIVSWVCTVLLAFVDSQDDNTARVSPSITKADQFLILGTPTIIAGTLGIIHAATDPDALVLSERFADFLHVATLGVACGLFLALPWFHLPFALDFWKEMKDVRN